MRSINLFGGWKMREAVMSRPGVGWLQQVRWPILVPMLIVTALLPLSIHVFMLNAGVPHPKPIADSGLIAWTNVLFTTAGTLLVFRHLHPGLSQRSVLFRAAIVLVLVAALSGKVFRDAFMDIDIVVAPLLSLSTTALLLDDYRPVLPLAAAVLLAALAASRTNGALRIAAASVVISVIVWLVVGYVLDPILDPINTSLDAHEGRPFEAPPYDARIQIPAYATYLEPAIASVVLVSLVWNRLPPNISHRMGAAVGIVFLLVGPVARPFIDAATNDDHLIGFLGPAQFSFETILLGLLAALSRLVGVRSQPVSRPSSG